LSLLVKLVVLQLKEVVLLLLQILLLLLLAEQADQGLRLLQQEVASHGRNQWRPYHGSKKWQHRCQGESDDAMFDHEPIRQSIASISALRKQMFKIIFYA
jgi:hypothetical protein